MQTALGIGKGNESAVAGGDGENTLERVDSIGDLEFTLGPAREICWTDITSGTGHSSPD